MEVLKSNKAFIILDTVVAIIIMILIVYMIYHVKKLEYEYYEDIKQIQSKS